MSDLARDVVKLPGWRWRPGMKTRRGRVVQGCIGAVLPAGDCPLQSAPDLDDPATGGLVLWLLEGRIEATRDGLGGWRLSDVSHEVYSDTLGQACARLAYLRGHWGRDDSP